jgi:hypothetical protein
MTIAPELKPIHRARQRPHAPQPLPVWMQVGVVVLLLVQGVQTAAHWYFASAAPSTTDLSRFEYVYQPDRFNTAAPQARNAYDPYGRASGNLSPAFQYAGYYAHAPGTLTVTPVHAYAPTTGRWVKP